LGQIELAEFADCASVGLSEISPETSSGGLPNQSGMSVFVSVGTVFLTTYLLPS